MEPRGQADRDGSLRPQSSVHKKATSPQPVPNSRSAQGGGIHSTSGSLLDGSSHTGHRHHEKAHRPRLSKLFIHEDVHHLSHKKVRSLSLVTWTDNDDDDDNDDGDDDDDDGDGDGDDDGDDDDGDL